MQEEYLLTESATRDYLSFAEEIALILSREKDLKASDIADEEFREVGDGKLEVFVMVKDRRLSYFFEKGQWSRA